MEKLLKLNAKTVGKKEKRSHIRTSKKSVATVIKKGVIQRKEIRNCQDHNESFWSENKEDHCICKKSSDRNQTFICTDDQFLQDRKHCSDQATALPGGKQMASKTLTYKSSNPQVAVVNSKGKVTAKKGRIQQNSDFYHCKIRKDLHKRC